MDERKRQIEELFQSALELDLPEQRVRFLERTCSGKADLRNEVEELLAASADAEEVFRAHERGHVRQRVDPVELIQERPGSMIGRYKLLQTLGEGGMGVVYLAEQQQPVRRRVALKIIKLGMDTRQVVARFEAERQALALMDHPNIARVLDAGATETGRPYFVMELVHGVPITQFCERNQLSTTARLKLFIPVCQAIQHAHQKGIIHRDLKPTNVLVTLNDPAAAGHPMVIDFGVAKATNQRLTEKTLFTHLATMIGTPAYMSPEQAEMSKLDVDTRSDIYSLGVLLYELLTGSPPFSDERLRNAGYAEMQRIICNEKPPLPSTQITRFVESKPHSLFVTRSRSLATDLDWIVMKCLEKERTRRYQTTSGLAADLQRHLDNQPVLARPPSRLYEFWKTVQRHQFGFAATGAVILVLIAGVVVSSRETRRARQAGHDARHRAYLADMRTLGESLDHNVARARQILDDYRPAAGKDDLRDFEWYYFNRLLSADQSEILGTHEGGAVTLLTGRDNTFITAGLARNWEPVASRIQIWDGLELKLKKTTLASGYAHGIARSQDGKWLAIARGLDIELRPLAQPDRVRVVLTNWHRGLKYSGWAQFLSFINQDTELAIADWADSDSLPLIFINIATDTARHPVPGGPNGLRGLVVSQDGLRLALREAPGQIAILDLPQGDVISRFRSYGGEFLGVYTPMMFMNDPDHLATASNTGEIEIWDIAATNRLRVVGNHDSFVSALALSPDGKRLVSAGLDQLIKVWNPQVERPPLQVLKGHKDQVLGLGFLSDGHTLVSCGRDETVRRWDLSKPVEPEAPWPLPSEQSYVVIRFGILAATDDLKHGEGWKAWDVSRFPETIVPSPLLPPPSMKGALIVPLPGTEYHLVWLSPNKAGDRVHLYRGLNPPEPVPDFPNIHLFGDRGLHFQNRFLMLYGEIGGVPHALVWDLIRNRLVHLKKADMHLPHAIAFASDGGFVITGDGRRLEKLDLVTGFPDVWNDATPGMVNTLAVLPDNRTVLAGGALGVLRKLDFATRHWDEVAGSERFISSLCVSPSGTRFATGDRSGNVKLWDVQSMREVATLGAHAWAVTGLWFTPDGRSLLSADTRALRVWRTAGL